MNEICENTGPFAPVHIPESSSGKDLPFPVIEIFTFFAAMMVSWIVLSPAEKDFQNRSSSKSKQIYWTSSPSKDTTRSR